MKNLSQKIQRKLDQALEKNYSNADMKQLVHDLAASGEALPRTRLGRYTAMKKYLDGKHDVEVAPPRALVDEVVVMDDEARSERENLVVDEELNETLHQLLLKSHNNYVDNIIRLMLASGRRINEIVEPEHPVKKLPRNKTTVKFSSLSKQKTPKSARVELYQMTPTEFIKVLKKVRDVVQGDATSSITKAVNRRLKKINKKLTSHKLRGIYALMMYESSDKKQNRNGYIQKILHHDTPEASLNYVSYRLAE